MFGSKVNKRRMKRRKRRLKPEERYNLNLEKQKNKLEEFAAHETEWADDLILWYKVKKIDMPADEYRACAFFINKEYVNKPGALTLLYKVYLLFIQEMSNVTRENAFDLLRYQFRLYFKALVKGGY
jgi:hypothetical protein